MVMKKVLVFGWFGMLILVGCKKGSNPADEFKITPPVNPFSEICYQGVQEKDTILMTLISKGNKLQYGKLSYNYFQKDRNEGTLVGAFHGDTLIGKYSFQSEGVTSVREVIFLKQGSSYIEGFGPVVDDHQGNLSFKDIKTIQFNASLPLVEVPCKEN
jgi:hypothetical protein